MNFKVVRVIYDYSNYKIKVLDFQYVHKKPSICMYIKDTWIFISNVVGEGDIIYLSLSFNI